MSATALHLAAFDGATDEVNRLLAAGADANARAAIGETPLLFAAMNGHTDAVRALLKYGADVNALPDEGGSALRKAVRNGYAGVVRLLLAKNADPDAAPPPKVETPEERAKGHAAMREAMGKTLEAMAAFGVEESNEGETLEKMLNAPPYPPLFRSGRHLCVSAAIQSGSVETLTALLEAGYPADPAANGTAISLAPLEAAQSVPNGLEMARVLLRYGANPNGVDDKVGLNPLSSAVLSGNIPMAKLLIEAGARTDGNMGGMGLLASAVMREDAAMIEFLLERNIGADDSMADFHVRNSKRSDLKELIERKRGPAWLASVKASDKEAVAAALRSGVDINAAPERDGGALFVAVANNDAAMVRLLLDAGADPTRVKNEHGVTPLHEATTKGATEIMALLLERGASATAEAYYGYTPLSQAAERQDQDAADLLIGYGAVLSVAEAILLRHEEAVADFWRRGTPVNYANESGMTALHAAVSREDVDLVVSLLGRGADIAQADRSGQTAIDYAVHTQNIAIVTFLLNNGAPLTSSDKLRRNLVLTAITFRNEPLLRLLLERGAAVDEPLGGERIKNSHPRCDALGQLIGMHRYIIENSRATVPPSLRDTNRLWAIIRTLLEFGADANAEDLFANPLLPFLIEFDAPTELIRYALEKGATVNPEKRTTKSPLLLAVKQNRADVVEALLDAGAHPNGGMTKETPLGLARDAGNAALVALLEQRGASDETRGAMVAGLGDEAGLFLRSAFGTPAVTLATMPTLDFSAVRTQMEERRAGQVDERRERLVREIASATPTSPQLLG